MPDDFELLKFTEDWWSSFMVYQASEEGRAYVDHVFEHVHKQHFADFLRDALSEFTDKED